MSFKAKVAMLRQEFGLEEATPIPVAVAKAAQFMGIVPASCRGRCRGAHRIGDQAAHPHGELSIFLGGWGAKPQSVS